jgi:hypothetical protein
VATVGRDGEWSVRRPEHKGDVNILVAFAVGHGEVVDAARGG